MAELREALEAAYEKHTSEEPENELTPAGGQEGGSTEDSSQPLGDSSQETSAATPAADKSATPGTTPAKPEGDKSVQQDKDRTAKPQDEARQSSSQIKAPVSWKPAVREHWAKLPPAVQQEVIRREQEIQRGLSSAAEARRFNEEFNNVVRPFEGIIRSQNSTPIAAVRNLMTTAAGLTMGSPLQKANIVAEILQNYGVDIEILDKVLSGKPPEQLKRQDPGIRDAISQELAPIRQFMTQQQAQQAQQQQYVASVAEEVIDDWEVGKDFAGDLYEDMADIMDHSLSRGRKMTLDQAYDIAARAHPDIAPLYERTIAASRANSGNDKANRARHAASSVRPSGPIGGSSVAPTDLRGAISAAYEKHSRA